MSEWKKVKIGDICRIVKGTTGIASAEPGEYPLVVTAEERKTCSSYQFDQEAVCIPLVSSSGHGRKSLKNVHYQSGKFALGTILCAVIPNKPEQLDTRFLHQYLQFYKDTILVPLMKGAANVSLSMKDIAAVEIPLPPIEKQRELSDLFITLQKNQKKLVAETEKQFEYTKQLRQNILQDAIEGKLTVDLPCRQTGWRKHSFKNLSGKLVSEVSDKYFAYVLECDDGSLYKGFTQNLFERINRHLEGRGSEWTAKHIPVSLIYFEEFDTEKEALEREKYFKSDSGREYINEIRNRNKLDYDAEALFEKIQKREVRSKLRTDVLIANTPLRHEFSTENSIVSVSERTTPSAGDTPATPPFEIPKGWKWVQLGNLGILSGGKRLPVGESFSPKETKHIYIRIKDMKNDSVELNDLKYISDSLAEKLKRYCIYKDELYITIAGTIGQVGIIPECLDGMNLTENSSKLKPFIIKNVFLKYFIKSKFIQSQFTNAVYGMALPKLALKRIASVSFPTSPIKRTRRNSNQSRNLTCKSNRIRNPNPRTKNTLRKTRFWNHQRKAGGKINEF